MLRKRLRRAPDGSPKAARTPRSDRDRCAHPPHLPTTETTRILDGVLAVLLPNGLFDATVELLQIDGPSTVAVQMSFNRGTPVGLFFLGLNNPSSPFGQASHQRLEGGGINFEAYLLQTPSELAARDGSIITCTYPPTGHVQHSERQVALIQAPEQVLRSM